MLPVEHVNWSFHVADDPGPAADAGAGPLPRPGPRDPPLPGAPLRCGYVADSAPPGRVGGDRDEADVGTAAPPTDDGHSDDSSAPLSEAGGSMMIGTGYGSAWRGDSGRPLLPIVAVWGGDATDSTGGGWCD